MSATPRKLRLNIQTLRQLTNREAGAVVGGDDTFYLQCQGTHDSGCMCQTGGCNTNTCYTYCGGCQTALNEVCCVDGTFSTLRWDF